MSIEWESLAEEQQMIIQRLQRELQDHRTSSEEQTLAQALSVQVATLRQIDASVNGRLIQ